MISNARPYLSIIIPAYNEERRIEKILEAAKNLLKEKKFSSEVIVVDDGSQDRTVEIVESYRPFLECLTIIRHANNSGKGAAVKTGMLAARGDLRLFADADNSTPLEELDKLIPYFSLGYDVVFGSRGLHDSKILQRQPLHRVVLGKIGNKIIQTLTLRGVMDTQCGFKMFSAKAAQDLFACQKINGWGFDIEILTLARKLGYNMKEVPVMWVHDGNTRIKTKDYVNVLSEIITIKRNLKS